MNLKQQYIEVLLQQVSSNADIYSIPGKLVNPGSKT